MKPALALYVRDMKKIGAFYLKHFGFVQDHSEMPGILPHLAVRRP
jgi:hypothetical protein